MSPELLPALYGLCDRMLDLATRDAEVRAWLQTLAREFLAATETTAPDPAAPVVAEIATASPPPALPPPAVALEAISSAPVVPAEPGPRVELRFAQASSAEVAERVEPARWMPVTDADLPLIEARCRLKAEGARWAGERQRLIGAGAGFATEIEPKDRDIIQRAKALEGCFLWTNHRSGPSPTNIALFDELAGCFDTLAAATSLVRTSFDERAHYREVFEQSLDLLAESQSALRVAAATIDGPVDSDQTQVYNWLRTITAQEHIYLQRFMRADDAADPAKWSDVAERIERLESQWQERRQQERQRKKLLSKVLYLTKRIAEPGGGEEKTQHWRTLANTVQELADRGVPPSHRELRELLLPVIDDLPDLADVPQGFQLALREIDRYLASRPAPRERESGGQATAEVRRVAQLLAGKSVVLIGGDRRPDAQEALVRAFGLKELIWFEPREQSPSIQEFEPYVARPGVSVVLLAIRWVRHAYSGVREYCDRHSKPLVRLPGGYNPNQVAAQILQQAEERLSRG